MNKLGFAVSVLAIVATATWAYNVTYATKTTLGRIDDLRGRIAAEHEHIQVLRVEWAWLNNPERLTRLADQHAAALGLVPLSPEMFERVALMPYPPEDEPEIDAAPPAEPEEPADALVAQATLPGAEALLVMAPQGSMRPPVRPAGWSTR